MFYAVILCLLILLLPFFLYRTVKGPSVFDRVLGLSGITTKAIIILIFIGIVLEQAEMFMDLALGFGLLNLVGSLAVGKYLEQKGDRL